MVNLYVFVVTMLLLLWWYFTLGQLIRSGRLRCNWTQEKLAEIVDVQPRSVQRWEADESYPRPGHLALLSEVGVLGEQTNMKVFPYIKEGELQIRFGRRYGDALTMQQGVILLLQGYEQARKLNDLRQQQYVRGLINQWQRDDNAAKSGNTGNLHGTSVRK